MISFSTQDINILIVDDMADNLKVLANTLSAQGYQVRCAKNGSTALRGASAILPDLILLDIKMPDLDGYEVCQRLKANILTCNIPVIFLSALDDVLDKVRAFEVGGVDFISKPIQVKEVLVRVKNQIALQLAHAKISQLNQELEIRVQQRTIELKTVNQSLLREINERQRIQQKLVYDSLHDGLTGLGNRSLLMERVEWTIKHAQRHPDYMYALLFIDLDRFKVINDSLGHSTGDRLLIAVANSLQKCLRENDLVARLGGDEFVILLDGISSIEDATMIGDRIQGKLRSPFELKGQNIFTSASIGIVFGSPDYTNAAELLRDADIAMYRAKAKGKSRYEIFDMAMYQETLKLLELENHLRQAVKRNEFVLHYQPIISLNHSKLVGFEALIRWQHPTKGSIPPVEFIPLAEDTGLILEIGEWLLKEACQQLKQWQQKFAQIPQVASLKMNVNIASQQLQQPEFIQKLDRILQETGLNGNCLRLEITESVLIDPEGCIQNTLKQIRERNIKLSIDDFGTGYSSLSYLRRFPIDNLKIDRSFIEQMNYDLENLEIVRVIITLAKTLGMDAISEGVETPQQLQQLKALGCEFGQGFLFSKPLPSIGVESMLAHYPKSFNENYPNFN
ncbi:two-component system response regulator [Pleurocapsa sp. FMAR1]|uniref:two-component system response regulator n=1 Tax=Pleurocapsa sp. FMAR1 TaxID=3040204 RepID=UPI0029C90378|nr:EAL domain-containing protein [Pleurocapsa sp. FMAR1]